MSRYETKKKPGDTAWFTHDRFGMFIHWGLYSMPARHEWVKNREEIPEDKYDTYFRHFDPDLYDPRDWARRAREAGMKYAVLTAKHHEGFCMFDSAYTDYKCTNTPAGRDLVREYVDAFRAEGLKVGFYYSLLDWHHPEFPIDTYHPRRDDPDAEEMSRPRDISKYALYMREQVTELLTHYGKIDILWFDFSYSDRNGTGKNAWMRGKGKDDWESEKLIALARSLQPGIIIDNRTEIDQDIWTPEQFQVTDWVRHPRTGERVIWETCQTMSGSWGYYRDEQTWKSPEMLLRLLINSVSLGGNLLMNVGPTSRGYLDDRATAALGVYGDWMKLHSRSIYGCTMAEEGLTAPADTRFTQSEDGKRLYVHLFAYPFGQLEIKGLRGRVDYAQFLGDGSEVLFHEGKYDHSTDGTSDNWDAKEQAEADDSIVLDLPPVKPKAIIPVIELFLK